MSWKASGIAKELTVGLHGERLSMADKLVLMILSENYIEKKGFVWCSQQELSTQCLCTSRGLRGILDRLHKFGLVGIVHRGRRGNYYSLPFMGNGVPQKVSDFEERSDTIEERIEERHAHLEEPARSSRTVDGIDGKDSIAPQPGAVCSACGLVGRHLCKGKPRKPRPERQNGYRRENRSYAPPPIQKGPTPAETNRERTAEALRVLGHPERFPDDVCRAITPNSG